MDTDERNRVLVKVGKELARVFRRFTGYLQFNFAGGKYVNTNVHETVRDKEKGESVCETH